MSRRMKLSVAAAVFAALVGASYFVYMEEQGNFHAITPGEAYRSAILDRDELEQYVAQYNIKSIVNLLGEKPRETWYQEEMDVTAAHHLNHYNLSLPALRELTEKEVQKLVEIIKTAPRPVLIHCKSGADRSGLAAAMWKVIVDNEPKSEAGKQLSIWYGHVPLGGTIAMDRFFERWKPPPN